jgi:hypothetical protein
MEPQGHSQLEGHFAHTNQSYGRASTRVRAVIIFFRVQQHGILTTDQSNPTLGLTPHLSILHNRRRRITIYNLVLYVSATVSALRVTCC